MKLENNITIKRKAIVALTTACLISVIGYSSANEHLSPSIPADMGEDTGGNIVMEQVYHQLSIVGVKDSIRFQFKSSPDDIYTVTGVNVPDGMSLQMENERKRFFVSGIPTAEALAVSPYETEITLSNSTDSKTMRFQWHIRDGVQPSTNSTISLCGGNPNEGGTLWSWAWAGVDQEHITKTGVDITRLEDLSGNGNHYFSPDESGHKTEVGYSWRTYYTPYPTVGLNDTKEGEDFEPQALQQNVNLGATGPFYLVAAVMNTKTGGSGNREIFGSLASGNVLRYSQDKENTTTSNVGILALEIDGTYKALTEKHSYTSGPMLIEVLRDESDVVKAMVNGIDLTINGGIHFPGDFNMTGLSSTGVSGFDDAGFEYIVCKGLPDDAQRSDVREYLRSKWNLYAQHGNEELGYCRVNIEP